MRAPEVIDAVFVETKSSDGQPSYGRRTTAQPANVADASADLLETSAPLIDAVAGVARSLGAEGAAERAGNVAELARAGAEVARAAPVAVAAIQREMKPVKSAFGRLVQAAKKSGIVGERRPPVDFERVERRPKSHGCHYKDPECSPDRVCDGCYRDARGGRR